MFSLHSAARRTNDFPTRDLRRVDPDSAHLGGVARTLSTSRSTRRFGSSAALCLLLFSALPAASAAATLTVGSNAVSCDFTSLNMALAALQPGDVLQLEARSFSNTSSLIANFNLATDAHLVGGFIGCSGAQGTGMTTLAGQSTALDSTLEVIASDVTLERLIITGGTDDDDFGGGIELFSSQATVRDCEISGNESDRGGGIYVSSGSVLRLEGDVTISQNSAFLGAGIAAQDATVQVLSQVPTQVRIVENDASGNGGGLFLDSGDISLFTSRDVASSIEIEDNVSESAGGGIYATTNLAPMLLRLHGDGSPIVIAGNEAGLAGGGLYAIHAGFVTQLRGHGVWVMNNQAVPRGVASSEGGGFALRDGANFRTTEQCPGRENCVVFSGNRAARGGAIALTNTTDSRFESTLFELNGWSEDTSGIAEDGAVVVLDDAGLQCRNCIVRANDLSPASPGSALFSGVNGSYLLLNHATVVDNRGHEHLFDLDFATQVDRSILWQNDGDLFAAPSGPRLHCAVVPPGQVLPTINSDISTTNPGFVSPFDDLRLQQGSPALDLCDSNGSQSASQVDFAGAPRLVGAEIDPGAYEWGGIFADGFERANTSAWN
ncbi:MAG: hypothetical protein DWQ36_13830 [Acidobacteria bacterium]|nr:MAG: hypothetical protein DWQ30_20125 [Acidobacteriota bacterium]REK06287.1 MAG: hypothetical protein DWQ36_13830 [Acidobacteriota bacterium]